MPPRKSVLNTQYGYDVAAVRADDLDRAVLQAIEKNERDEKLSVLDIGCGSGGLAGRMARAGADVTALDIDDYHEAIDQQNAQRPVAASSIAFVQANIANWVPPEPFMLVVMQRVLHYLPHQSAVAVLTRIREHTTERAFVSVTGVESAIGAVHPASAVSLAERFATLPTDAQATFGIHQPLCVYTHDEFGSAVREAGWQIEKLWSSAFGNHKAILRP